MLLLEAPLPERADIEVPGLPVLDVEVRREEGPEVSAPVGETDSVGDPGLFSSSILIGDEWNPKSRFGMSPSISSVSALYRTYGVLGSVIFMRLSFCISVRARFSSSHCRLCEWAPGSGGAFFKIPFGFGRDAERGRGGSGGLSSTVDMVVSG